jgi:poly [ADP-ribose] polymerase
LGLQETGRILEERKIIYDMTLNMSDLSTGINSYYILQVVQDDNKTACHVIHEWG